jgi:hypothetical protein
LALPQLLRQYLPPPNRERARHEWLKGPPGEHTAGLQRRMRYAPDVPELRKDTAAAGMDGLRHLPPSLDLRLIVDARRECIAFALRRDVGSLSND